MQRRKLIEENQKVTQQDFLDFGLFPQESLDAIGEGLLIPDAAFWGFPVSESDPTTLIVGNGHLIFNGVVYVNDDAGGTEIDLISPNRLPVATRRYVSITVWGQDVDSNIEPRTFLLNAVTRETEARQIPTVRTRRAEISAVSGVEGPDPVPPAIANNVVEVARVLLDTSGIISIEMVEDNRAPTLRGLQVESLINSAFRTRISAAVDTLASNLAALAGRIRGFATRDYVLELAGELAHVKEVVDLPDDYSAWGFDLFLDNNESDITHPDYLAHVQEGIRFPDAQVRDAQLGLLNPTDTAVTVQGNFMLPRYTQVSRVSVTGKDSEIPLAQYQFQTLTLKTKTKIRKVIHFGIRYVASRVFVYYNAIPRFRSLSIAVATNHLRFTAVEVWTPRPAWWYSANIIAVRLPFFWSTKIVETTYYWDAITTSVGINGTYVSQTFLNTQEGWLTGLDLFFSRKAATGDVNVALCEVTDSGAPNFNEILATAVIPVASIVADLTGVAATRATFVPTALKAGRRYGVIVATAAAHQLWSVTGNKLLNGSMFISTDGAWSMGDLTKDLALRLYYAKFDQPRVEVQMQPLQLENGIANIEVKAEMVEPENFNIEHQVQVNGVWRTLNENNVDAVTGLPALLPYRIVFNGTTDMMPGCGLASNSRVITSRPRSDFRHISEDREVGSAVDTVYVTLRLEQWRGAPFHTCTIKLLLGEAFDEVVLADIVEDEEAHDDPDALIRKATFDLTPFSPLPEAYKIRIEGTTDNVVTPFHVSERKDVAVFVGP